MAITPNRSSKLLINEPALQVLPTLATLIGLNEAIILQQIHYWITHAQHYGHIGKEVDGRRWIRNSIREWQKTNFPWWGRSTIHRALAGLVEGQYLLTKDDLNDEPYDKTVWYSIDYARLDQLIHEADESKAGPVPKWDTPDQPAVPEWDTPVPDRDSPVPERDTLSQNGTPPRGNLSQNGTTIPEIENKSETTSKNGLFLSSDDWADLKSDIGGIMDPSTFRAWLQDAELAGQSDDHVFITVRNDEAAEAVNARLSGAIANVLSSWAGRPMQVTAVANGQTVPA